MYHLGRQESLSLSNKYAPFYSIYPDRYTSLLYPSNMELAAKLHMMSYQLSLVFVKSCHQNCQIIAMYSFEVFKV